MDETQVELCRPYFNVRLDHDRASEPAIMSGMYAFLYRVIFMPESISCGNPTTILVKKTVVTPK